MGETYDQLVTLADDQQAAQLATRTAAQALGAGVQLLLQLAALKFGLGEGDVGVLRQALNPETVEGGGSSEVGGWGAGVRVGLGRCGCLGWSGALSIDNRLKGEVGFIRIA